MDLRKLWEEQPLTAVVLIALVVRVIAAIWAPGYLFHDDHYVIVEPASSWADGADFNHWLPWSKGNTGPQWTSMFYVGTVWLMFEGLQAGGVEHPGDQMLVIRLVHALWSLLTVYFGFLIARRFSDWKTARTVGLLIALFAFLPNLSGKQLQEMVCIPPIMGGLWWLVKSGGKQVPLRHAITGGLIIGFAVGLRYQAGIIPLFAGIALVFSRNFKAFLAFGVASAVTFSLSQLQDFFLWGRPFAHLQAYMEYNSNPENIQRYIILPWYNYAFTLLGFLIPPASLMLLFGFWRESRRALVIVLPVTAFIVFHSIYPNKQERFLLPVIPLLITVGTVGWYRFKAGSRFWAKARGLHTALWVLFWLINIPALLVFSTSGSKTQKIEAMIWLYERGDLRTFVHEYSHTGSAPMPPQHYANNWRGYHIIQSDTNLPAYYDYLMEQDSLRRPNYIVFVDEDQLQERVNRIDSVFGGISMAHAFYPGRMDRIFNRLNPKYNTAENLYVYKIRNPDGVWKAERWFERGGEPNLESERKVEASTEALEE